MKTLQSKLYLLTVLVLCTFSTQAQTNLLWEKLHEIIIPKDRSYLERESVIKPVIMFSYAIGTDKHGKIDTIVFSNSIHRRDAEFMQMDRAKEALKKENLHFKADKNTLFLGNVLIANGEHQEVTANGIYWAWSRLYEDIKPLIGKKKLVLMNPMYYLFYYKKIMH